MMTTETVAQRIERLGIELPECNPPAANYLTYKISGSHIFIAGQTCRWNGEMKLTGKLGKDNSVEKGQEAARLCGMNILLQLKHALGGNFERVTSCVKLNVYVQSEDDFYEQAKVANGVSDLMIEIFGDKGKHVRAAVGTNALPSNSMVEVESVFEIDN